MASSGRDEGTRQECAQGLPPASGGTGQRVRHPRITGAATPDKLAFAREQRRQPTGAEDRLWQALRGNALGVRFRRQHPVADFVLDFYCEKHRLAVEVDGPTHDRTDTYDRWRDSELARIDIRTLRLQAEDVDNHVAAALEAIKQAIRQAAHSATPVPSSTKGRGASQDDSARRAPD